MSIEYGEQGVRYTGPHYWERVVQAFEVALMLCEGEYLDRILRAFVLATYKFWPNREPPEGIARNEAQVLRQIADRIDPDEEEEWDEDWSELIERLGADSQG